MKLVNAFEASWRPEVQRPDEEHFFSNSDPRVFIKEISTKVRGLCLENIGLTSLTINHWHHWHI